MKILAYILLATASFGTFAQQTRQVIPEACMQPFYHGVASGDPLHDKVIIWTRVTPQGQSQAPIIVSWKMATDTAMTNLVQSGSVITTVERDFTVKIDVSGLQPDTWYYYEFYAQGGRSIQGRTRTAPAPSQMKNDVRFAVVSCANLEAGFFNAYGSLAERMDFDAVLCLGDYIYEYETGGYSPNATSERYFEPVHEIVSLEDYRMRYSIYKLDPDLRRLHQLAPWFCIWDDHESANDSWTGGAENHNAGEGNWNARVSAAKQAYFEWLPIRDNVVEGLYEIYRTIPYGQLVDLIMLDTRLQGRDEQVTTTSSILNSPTRTMLGTVQHQWLLDQLTSSDANYKIIAQQVMMSPLEVFGIPVNMDQWDGYPVEREQLLNHIISESIDNFVVLTGDIHTAWAMEIPASSARAGLEFVTPSVTSPGLDLGNGVGSSLILASNPHIKWVDLQRKGYMIVNINDTKIQSDWYFVNTIDVRDPAYAWGKSYYANQGTNQLVSTSTVTTGRADLTSDLPQLCPRIEQPQSGLGIEESQIVVMGLYPNPVQSELNIQFSNYAAGNMEMQIVDAKGALVWKEAFVCQQGSWIKQVNIAQLAKGVYTLVISADAGVLKRNFTKE